MVLTGKIADNSRVQTPNNANTEQVNRQIRALVPGQTLRGEVVSREGNNAQIRLLQDVLVDAKVDADIRLELGQNITFQVKNNGQTLNLSPLFTNMATEGTVLKALDMASHASRQPAYKRPIGNHMLETLCRYFLDFPEGQSGEHYECSQDIVHIKSI